MRIGYIIFTVFILLTLAACQEKDPKTYEDFEHLEYWSEVDDLEEGKILIFYYSPYCPACKSIQEEVVGFKETHGDKVPLHFMIPRDYQGTPPVELRSVPAILVFEDHAFIEMIIGANNCKAYLSELASDL
jgi:thiol-disulfide isomerase/thioredoxin